MSATTSTSRTSTWAGIAIGVLLLGLVAAFAIGLPKAEGGDGGAAAAGPSLPDTLPDTLPGGYAAADEATSFAGGDLAQQADQIAQQQAESTAYGNRVLPDVLGVPAVTRSYVHGGKDAVFVQVFRSEGHAFSPNSFTDPGTTSGSGGITMDKVGDGVCILTYGQSQDGSAGDPVSSQCQVTRGGLTVQIESNGVPADDLVTAADGLLDELGA